MNREEAKKILEEVKILDDSMYQYNKTYLQALDMAIKALERQPCEDCISREEALKNQFTAYDHAGVEYKVILAEMLKILPSVQPKAKTEWIPIKTRPLTEEEKTEMGTESDYMYDCPLPENGEEVEVTTHLGDVTMDIFCRESGGCYFENYCDDGDVLAWRHKPEPYKEGGEGKG